MRAKGLTWRSALALLAAGGLAVSLASCDPDAPDASSTAQASPSAPPTKASTLQPTPTPTVETVVTWQSTDHSRRTPRTADVQVGSEVMTVEYDCGDVITDSPMSIKRYGFVVLAWSAVGGGILFDYDGALWLADDMAGSTYYLTEVNAGPYERPLVFGFFADISPAGDRVVYTTCESLQGVRAGGSYAAVAHEPGPPSANYDIVIGEIGENGRYGITNNTRITSTRQRLDHYPVWSPDGLWLASLSMDRTPSQDLPPKFVLGQDLHLRRADGSNDRTILVSTLGGIGSRGTSNPAGLEYQERLSGGIALIPPVWSPDGQYLAYYLVTEKDGDLYTYELHIIRTLEVANPSDLATRDPLKIGTVTSAPDAIPPRPSWSPDGQRIAFVADDGIDRELFVAQADGTDRRQVASDPEIREIAWSPDGSEILIVSDRPNLVFVSPDGASRRQVELPPTLLELSPARSEWSPIFEDGLIPDLVVWSPDGSRIALSVWGLLVTMGRDGTNPRTLNGGDLRRPAVDPAVCSVGVVVPDPEANPGLVRDCETLLKSVETLAGDSLFRWSPDRPITRWAGVRLKTDGSEGLPLRVRELSLEHQGLAGSIPPMLGDLDALEVLVLSNHRLTGPIPPALGKLTALRLLYLRGSGLSGTIPPALGKLTALRELDLSYTGLSGTLPPELANLTNLTSVDITNTELTGCIPRDFSGVWMDGSDLRQWRCPAASGQ